MVVTRWRISEQILRLYYGGNIPVGGKVLMQEVQLAVAQSINRLLKTEYFQVNSKIGEAIPNGTVLAVYDNIPVSKYKNVSQCTLPIKPLKLPRNMGIFSIFDADNPSLEYIPLQMGQWALLQSQPLLNDLMGQCGYENYGMQIVFTKDITNPSTSAPKMVSMRLAVMDISQYGDFDPLPVMPEMEATIIEEVYKLFSSEAVADRVVDPGHKEQKGIPLSQQAQT